MATMFIPSPTGLKLTAMTETMAQALLSLAGEPIADAAKSLAPVDEGDYKDNIEATAGVEGASALARVNAFVMYASFIEFGTVDTPTFAVLRRACESLGLRLSSEHAAY